VRLGLLEKRGTLGEGLDSLNHKMVLVGVILVPKQVDLLNFIFGQSLATSITPLVLYHLLVPGPLVLSTQDRHLLNKRRQQRRMPILVRLVLQLLMITIDTHFTLEY